MNHVNVGTALNANFRVNLQGLYEDYCEINTILHNTMHEVIRGEWSSKYQDYINYMQQRKKNMLDNRFFFSSKYLSLVMNVSSDK